MRVKNVPFTVMSLVVILFGFTLLAVLQTRDIRVLGYGFACVFIVMGCGMLYDSLRG